MSSAIEVKAMSEDASRLLLITLPLELLDDKRLVCCTGLLVCCDRLAVLVVVVVVVVAVVAAVVVALVSADEAGELVVGKVVLEVDVPVLVSELDELVPVLVLLLPLVLGTPPLVGLLTGAELVALTVAGLPAALLSTRLAELGPSIP